MLNYVQDYLAIYLTRLSTASMVHSVIQYWHYYCLKNIQTHPRRLLRPVSELFTILTLISLMLKTPQYYA